MPNMVLLEESEPNTIYIALTAPTSGYVSSWWSLMQNKTRTQEISALGHLVIQNSSGPVNDRRFYWQAH